MRFHPRPRVVDGAILATLAVGLLTGAGTVLAGDPSRWWIVGLHASVGLLLLVPLALKLHRERRQLDPRRWSRRTAGSILLTVVALATVATGLVWASGGDPRAFAWSGLVVHSVLGLLLLPILLVHLHRRFRLPRRTDFEGRRTAVQAGLLLGGAGLVWWAQRAAVGALDAAAGASRFTGSRPTGGAGNDFPVTSWVADDPAPVDVDRWRLRVHGAVERERSFALADLDASAGTDRTATLDCTSGWFADRRWSGLALGPLLDAAGPTGDARWVIVRSVTGYRVSLPLEEARTALLATHVDGERVTHGHGYPLRLVAPGRRGFQWVKWVDSVEVRTRPDYGAWWSLFASGFS